MTQVKCKWNGLCVDFGFGEWILIGLVSLFNVISTIMTYLMPNPFLQKNSNDTIKPIVGEDKGFILF